MLQIRLIFYFANGGYTLKARQTGGPLLVIAISADKTSPSYSDSDLLMGLKEIVINGTSVPVVPEPATASLSLLGLAALMMRRRRA